MLFEPRKKLDVYEEEMLAFSKEPKTPGLIMFYGDSTFTRWKPEYENPRMEDDLRGRDGAQAVVNHGFGGATAEDLLYNYHRAVRPWAPRALVLKSFGNDAGAGYSPFEILFLLYRVIDYARADFPGIKIYLCGPTPQLRYTDMPRSRRVAMAEFRDQLAAYCAEHGDSTFVDPVSCPLFYRDPARTGDFTALREDVFVADRGHCNAEGYKLLRRFFLDVLGGVL